MRDSNYCFYHLNLAGHRLRLESYAARGLRRPPVELPPLEDAASIQLALMRVTEALLDGSLDHRTAGLVLYSLQTASTNLRTMQNEAKADSDAGNAICNRYDSFEQDYELGDEADMRVEEPAEEENLEAKAAEIVEGAKYAGLIKDETSDPHGEDDDTIESSSGDDDPVPTIGPINYLDHDPVDRAVRIPLMLSKVQYEQAKVAIFGYQMLHGIDREHPDGRKPITQRAAISQKISLPVRRPVASVPSTPAEARAL
jgi:hypothetical protein